MVGQWPSDPLPVAKWLVAMGWPPHQFISICDAGLVPNDIGIPKKFFQSSLRNQKINPEQLKHIGLIIVFVAPDHPVATMTTLKANPEQEIGPVSQYVLAELEMHYSVPKLFDKMTHCLRPDLMAMVYKTWKHTPDPKALDAFIDGLCKEQWVLNPYTPVTRHVASALAWCGAAVVETGQKSKADMVIGTAYYNICHKDRAIAILAILYGIQHNELTRSVFEAGPPLFQSLCHQAPRVC